MRRVIESTLVSLDGVTEAPGAWTGDYFDGEAAQLATEQLTASDAMLMGKRTYEMFAAMWPAMTGAYADQMNSIRKYVFSSTLKQAEWDNTSIIGGDVLTEACAQAPGWPGPSYLRSRPPQPDAAGTTCSMSSGCGSTCSSWAPGAVLLCGREGNPEAHGDQDAPERRHRPDLSTRGNLIAPAQAEASKHAAPEVTANMATAIPAQVNPMTNGERHLQMGEAHV